MVHGPHEHLVRFYDRDDELVAVLAGAVVEALTCGEPFVCVATPDHRTALDSMLEARGIDVALARASGAYHPRDAAETLALFMVDDRPDAGRFEDAVGSLLDVAAAYGSRVRAFGEMVALLWAEGKEDAAIELEELWNRLAESRDFSLLCAYPTTALLTASLVDTNRACATHTRVLPPASYAAGAPGAAVVDSSMVLVAVPEAVTAARRFVSAALPLGLDSEAVKDAELVVSELATNAVRHAFSAFRLSVKHEGDNIRVAVEDAASTEPRERNPSPEERGGRGVAIVGKLASDWGYDLLDDGKVVWAELVES